MYISTVLIFEGRNLVSQEVLLVIVGGAIGLASSLVSVFMKERFDRQRLADERKHALQDQRRDHLLAVLKEKYEPALELLAATMKIVETSKTAEEAFSQLEALRKETSIWTISVRLTDEYVKEQLLMAIRYSRITESEENWKRYKSELVLAISELSEIYDKAREHLFENND